MSLRRPSLTLGSTFAARRALIELSDIPSKTAAFFFETRIGLTDSALIRTSWETSAHKINTFDWTLRYNTAHEKSEMGTRGQEVVGN